MQVYHNLIKMSIIRTRYAPSPTGYLHAGQIRSALFNYLFAKQKNGVFVLRIEDTDRERSKKEFEDAIYEDLKWLGIEPDESPRHGGDFGPYRQSERGPRYRQYLEKLISEKKAFFCFHSEEETFAGKFAIHRCDHKKLSEKQREEKVASKESYVIRFDISQIKGSVGFKDLVRGDLSFDPEHLEDFSIARNLEAPLYNFAVVIDDHEMAITHVVRGEDHISNTHKQLLLYKALGFKKPEAFAHLPLVLAPDRSKLSKRKGAKAIGQYREEGYLPEALLNFLALLGWSPGNDRELLSKEDLIKEFSLERVQKSGAVFDEEKLNWMNGEYIRSKPPLELVELVRPFLEKSGWLQNPKPKIQNPNDYLKKIIELEQSRLKKLSEIGERTDYFFKDPEYNKELLCWKKMSDEELRASIDKSIQIVSDPKLEFNRTGLEAKFLEEIGIGGDKGSVLWPLRAALSGKKASPGPFELMDVLGREETLKRLTKARAQCILQ